MSSTIAGDITLERALKYIAAYGPHMAATQMVQQAKQIKELEIKNAELQLQLQRKVSP